ncbi:MAG: PTS system mannose/fructose/sorbose family transporter subunit IID [bacterium]|nr:PTS system mannose/fructose/sorbose family transporter subunit IID [bacterium]
MAESKPITKLTLFWVGLRASCIMAVWNFERMLNIGFTYSLLPVLRRLYSTAEQRKQALSRHLKFFNTHPYFASYILGLVIAKEEKLANENAQPSDAAFLRAEQDIQNIKTTLMGPFGALGDTFFWSTFRPFLALLAVMMVILNIPNWTVAALAPIGFVVWYNVAHIYIRIGGVYRGYKLGDDIVLWLRQFNLANTIEKLQKVGLAIAGIFLGLTGLYFCSTTSDWHSLTYERLWFAIKILILTLIVYIGLHKKMHTTRIFLLGLLAISGYELTIQYRLGQIYGFALVGIVMMLYFTVVFWGDIKEQAKG